MYTPAQGFVSLSNFAIRLNPSGPLSSEHDSLRPVWRRLKTTMRCNFGTGRVLSAGRHDAHEHHRRIV
jgi:hypothetical protein